MSLIKQYNNELYHHGVKGMKWGVRRYQNADGSLTSAGKKRYGSGRDHSQSNKSEIAELVALSIISLATLNPIGATGAIVRLVQAGKSNSNFKKFDTERTGCDRDSKTGFLIKKKDYTAEEDAARVNPLVKNFDTNTKNNCMLCTAAYDLRRRGYEVRAKKASYGYMPSELKVWYPKAKIKQAIGLSNKEMRESLKENLIAQGDGARGNLMVQWKYGYGGHSMAYEVQNGSYRIIDAQSNKIYTNPDRILKQCTNFIEYARLDNVQFSPKYIKEVAE